MPTVLQGTLSAMIKYLRPAILLFSLSLYILFQLSTSSLLQKKRLISVSFASLCGELKIKYIPKVIPKGILWSICKGEICRCVLKGKSMPPHSAWGFLSSILNKEHALTLPCQCQMNLLNKEIWSPIISSLRSFFHQLYPTAFLLVSQELVN